MKVLKLTPALKKKLDRLSEQIKTLSYVGEEPTSFENSKIVAIVGTRKPTPYGKLMTERITEDLARAGVVVISGLALGVDGIAHSTCLKAGGKTIAVIASGLNHIGPATNKPIADNIIKSGGTILSEYSHNHQPRKVEFLERNRIIAAFSDAVVITEAAGNSGSLNTANHAKSMNIPVFAVPGNVTSPLSTGTNHLIKNGAQAITEGNDVLKHLGITEKNTQLSLDLVGDTPEETIILQKIAHGATSAVDIQLQTKLSTVDFQTAATMLEVQGKITQDSLGNWRLK